MKGVSKTRFPLPTLLYARYGEDKKTIVEN